MIYGVCGFIGSGKNTVGDILEENGYQKLSFAATLKDATAAIFGWPRHLLEGDTAESREFREKNDEFWSERLHGREITPRKILQQMGTEVMRNNFDQNVWLYSLERRIDPNKNYVITDARFQNEIKFIKELGGKIIVVERGEKPIWWNDALIANSEPNNDDSRARQRLYGAGVHPSEYSWIGVHEDIHINNNGTLDDLRNVVTSFLTMQNY